MFTYKLVRKVPGWGERISVDKISRDSALAEIYALARAGNLTNLEKFIVIAATKDPDDGYPIIGLTKKLDISNIFMDSILKINEDETISSKMLVPLKNIIYFLRGDDFDLEGIIAKKSKIFGKASIAVNNKNKNGKVSVKITETLRAKVI